MHGSQQINRMTLLVSDLIDQRMAVSQRRKNGAGQDQNGSEYRAKDFFMECLPRYTVSLLLVEKYQ